MKEKDNPKYDCIMLWSGISKKDWKKYTDKIEKEDIYDPENDGEYGIESEPHITLLYGIHSDEVDKDLAHSMCKAIGEIELETEKISIFENDDFDVVKLEIIPNDTLLQLRKIFIDTLPNTQNFPDYNPHITISYVKKGKGKKYIENFKESIKFSFNKVAYSDYEYKKKYFNLKPLVNEKLQYLKLFEEFNYDAYEEYDNIKREELYNIIGDYKKGLKRQPWKVVDPNKIKRLWQQYSQYGFVRDEKGIEKIKNQFITNIIKLEINTVLSGHSPESPNDFWDTYIGYVYKGSEKSMDDSEELPFTKEEFNEWTEEYFFDDNWRQWRISDYAMKPLLELAYELLIAETPEEKLILCDQIMNVVHMRGDIASLFIKGGSKSLSEISEINRDKEEVQNESNLNIIDDINAAMKLNSEGVKKSTKSKKDLKKYVDGEFKKMKKFKEFINENRLVTQELDLYQVYSPIYKSNKFIIPIEKSKSIHNEDKYSCIDFIFIDHQKIPNIFHEEYFYNDKNILLEEKITFRAFVNIIIDKVKNIDLFLKEIYDLLKKLDNGDGKYMKLWNMFNEIDFNKEKARKKFKI